MRLGADPVGEVDGKATHAFNDLDNIYVSTCCGSGSDDSESNNVDCDVLNLVSASISGVCAESTAVGFARGAVLPADWTVTRVARLAGRVAEEAAHL